MVAVAQADGSNQAASRESGTVTQENEQITQFYISAADVQRCQESIHTRRRITVLGLTEAGGIRAFTGVVRDVENIPEAGSRRRWRVAISNF
jgi:hypothetical protein